jgi:multidrug resistance protein
VPLFVHFFLLLRCALTALSLSRMVEMVLPQNRDDRVSHPGAKVSSASSSTSRRYFAEPEHSRHDIGDASKQMHDLEKARTAQDELPRDMDALQRVSTSGPVHSVFGKHQKRFIVFMASLAGFFSPVSANIYFPALNSLARDLNVSHTLINLTLTSYMVSRYPSLPVILLLRSHQIFQGLAPAFIGDLADGAGRRPAYTICFVLYIAANVGLALQDSFAALFVLRCLQSSGSSGTIALSSGVVADVATASERGKWFGLVTAGSLLGPSLGPVFGGLLAQYLGWRAIFWFLVIFAGAFFIPFLIFFPETGKRFWSHSSWSG